MKQPQVGTAVAVVYKNKLLLGRRISDHEGGLYGFPGGKMDYGENFEECVRREVREETQLELRFVKQIPLVTNNRYKDSHFICFWFYAEPVGNPDIVPYIEMKDGEPKNEGWKWYDINEILTLPTMRGIPHVIPIIAVEGSFNQFDGNIVYSHYTLGHSHLDHRIRVIED